MFDQLKDDVSKSNSPSSKDTSSESNPKVRILWKFVAGTDDICLNSKQDFYHHDDKFLHIAPHCMLFEVEISSKNFDLNKIILCNE